MASSSGKQFELPVTPTVEELIASGTEPRRSYVPSSADESSFLDHKMHASEANYIVVNSPFHPSCRVSTPNDANDGPEEFDQLEFLYRGYLFYPLGLFNHIIHAIWPTRSNKDYEEYFSRLPFGYIGCCWVLNVVVLGYIVYFQYSHGRDTTFYWLFVYEIFFAQALTAQVQLHLKSPEFGGFWNYAKAVLFGAHYKRHVETFCLTWEGVRDHVRSLRENHQSSPAQFVFPSVVTQGEYRDQESVGLPYLVDPIDFLENGPRKKVTSFTISKIVAIVRRIFIVIIICTSFLSVDSGLLVSTIGYLVKVPQLYDYSGTITTVPACRNASSTDDDEIARLFVGVRLANEPTVARGLPILSFQFTSSNNESDLLQFSIEEVWYATIYNTTSYWADLQVLDKQSFIAAMVSFPELPCSNIASVLPNVNEDYTDSSIQLDEIRYSFNSYDYTFWIFCIFVAVPPLVNSYVRRAKCLSTIGMLTWDYWHAFDSLTAKSKFGGVWIAGERDPLRIDFSKVENCIAWYELRKQLIDVTDINLRFVFPLLYISLLEFVLSLAGICWYVAVGQAPIPGFLLLICLCTNPMPMLIVLLPLYNIWKIQNGHIAMVSKQCLELELMPSCADMNAELNKQKALQVLKEIRTVLQTSDEHMSVLGFELSPAFFGTLGGITISAITFLYNGTVEFNARGGW